MAETAPGISALEALRTISLFRLFMPKSRIILCGGRQKNLRDLQALVFDAGANALMVGNYLTTLGRAVEADRQMLRDLALEADAP
jgi:biotin synthase